MVEELERDNDDAPSSSLTRRELILILLTLDLLEPETGAVEGAAGPVFTCLVPLKVIVLSKISESSFKQESSSKAFTDNAFMDARDGGVESRCCCCC